MTCEGCRDGISAAMDGESWPEQDAAVEDHLHGCAACREWQLGAEAANRALRLRPAEAVPDLSSTVTAALLAERPGRVRAAARRWGFVVTPGPTTWRVALGVLALAQLTLGLSELLGAAHGLPAPSNADAHIFNESSAWNAALGVGFAGAAMWPRLAAGLLPTLGIFSVILLGLSVADLVNGHVGVGRISTHVVLFAGFAVMLMVNRDHHHPHRPAAAGDDTALYGSGDRSENAAAATGAAPQRRGLRSVGRHAA